MSTVNIPGYNERPSCRVVLGEAVTEIGILMAIKISDGKAYKATDAAGYRVIGRNTDVGIIADSVTCNEDIALLDNSVGNPVTQASIGDLAYVENDHTGCVYAGSTNKLVAGKIVDVVAAGVYVDLACQSVASVSAPTT